MEHCQAGPLCRRAGAASLACKVLLKARARPKKKATQQFYESQGYFYDARAIAMEFGTATVSPHPFLRVSLESQAQSVSESLGRILSQRMESFKAKNL